MRILVIGADGYLGWPTCLHFAARGHKVGAVDNYAKRAWEQQVGVKPLLPVPLLEERAKSFAAQTGSELQVHIGDMTDPAFVHHVIDTFRPEGIIHYGEQPSAPFSMLSQECAVVTQTNNIVGTLNLLHALRDLAPDCHLIKLGTMGEYGTPGIDIEEGFIEIHHKGRSDVLPFPKQAGSFYHLSKVHDSHNIMFACRTWRLRSTDLHQGVVYGIKTDELENLPNQTTSYHYDDVFGTVLNRFCVQALTGHPLTVHGKGFQTRGFLNIRDTMQCVELAALNPPAEGEYRVFNQFTEQFSVSDLADRVVRCSEKLGIAVQVEHIPNPRVEAESHYYNATHTRLASLGLSPHLLTDDVLTSMLLAIQPYAGNADVSRFLPSVAWRRGKL